MREPLVNPCDACGGPGWLETTEETIERCDSCKVFANDAEAQAAYAKVGKFAFAFDNTECRDVLNAVAAWKDSLEQRNLPRAAKRVDTLLQRLINETRNQK